MRIKNSLRKTLLVSALMLTGFSLKAQTTEGGVFSLYSQYGLGELSTIGNATTKGMGGVGIASRDMLSLNMLNPAGYTCIPQKKVLFSIGAEGVNNYMKAYDDNKSNSRNFFNLSHIGIQFRLSKKFAFGLSVSPYSNMGYEMYRIDKNSDIIGSIGDVRYSYVGSGGIAQLKTGIGYTLFKNFNIGVNYVYYLGNFKQTFETTIINNLDDKIYKNRFDYLTSKANQSSVEFGIQYEIAVADYKNIVLAAVYQPRMSSSIKRHQEIVSSNGILTTGQDTIVNSRYNEKIYFPERYGLGIAYATPKLNLEINYSLQNWDGSFPENNIAGIRYDSRQEIRTGIQYIPNRFDIRSALKRWTYRAGFSYGTSYIVKNNIQSDEIAGTFGVGIPLQKGGYSLLNIAVEAGKSGAFEPGQVRNTFVKLCVGVSIFPKQDQDWFIRRKYK